MITIGARDVEGVIEDLQRAYEILGREEEDIEELRSAVDSLIAAANNAHRLAAYLTGEIDQLEEDGSCDDCGQPIPEGERGEDGYCARCRDWNN